MIAIRLGAKMKLHYQWFLKLLPIGKREEILLEHGDMYVMGDKTAGTDW